MNTIVIDKKITFCTGKMLINGVLINKKGEVSVDVLQ